jgi:hypothetical protein
LLECRAADDASPPVSRRSERTKCTRGFSAPKEKPRQFPGGAGLDMKARRTRQRPSGFECCKEKPRQVRSRTGLHKAEKRAAELGRGHRHRYHRGPAERVRQARPKQPRPRGSAGGARRCDSRRTAVLGGPAWRSAWPDLIVGLGITTMNADAAREVWTAACEEHAAAKPLDRAKRVSLASASAAIISRSRGAWRSVRFPDFDTTVFAAAIVVILRAVWRLIARFPRR